jgi:UDP-N-acetylglucosamine:LPS N-acetylglucosamine transferase
VPVAGTDLPRAVVCGNPVREVIRAVAAVGPDGADHRGEHRAAARAAMGIPADRTVIAAFAGSLGARRINDAVTQLAERWGDRRDVWIHHVVGSRPADELRTPTLPADGLHLEVVRYEDHMERLLAAADVAVCRSGGTTVAELAVVGVPAVFVPLPIAPRDHQTANAAALVAAGAAVVVPDAECDVDRLEAELGRMLQPEQLSAMTAAAASLGLPDAADRVADIVERFAR